MKRGELTRHWSRQVAGWNSSGLTQREDRERESISYASFKRWRLVLKRERVVLGTAMRFVPVRAGAAKSVAVMGRSTSEARRFGVAIRLRGERAVVLDERVDEGELARLIRLLEVLPC